LCVFWAQFLTQSDEDRFILEEPIMTADKVVIIMASKTHLERARQYGMGRAVILDATHGTCVYGITLSTAHVVDDHGHGLVVGHAYLYPEDRENLGLFLSTIANTVRCSAPEWAPSCVLTDACEAERNAVRCVSSAVFR
jgi:MULE transposase domain